MSTQPFHPAVDELLHPELVIWRANVGAPVALDLAPAAAERVTGIDVLSWNLAIGEARLAELLVRLRGGEFGPVAATPERPLVVLAQEAFRSDESVPDRHSSARHGGKARGGLRHDIVEIARATGLSLRYAPSMRNGVHRSDRGNAILSTAAFGTGHAFLLPHVRQRRVIVAAELLGVSGLWLVSAHLDVGGQLRERPRIGPFGGGRVAQIEAAARQLIGLRGSLVVGADLNTHLGDRDPALRALMTAGFRPARQQARWRHTFHGPLRLLLDHVLWWSPDGPIREVTVSRIDESPGDRGRRIFGSDHHPLLARIELDDSATQP